VPAGPSGTSRTKTSRTGSASTRPGGRGASTKAGIRDHAAGMPDSRSLIRELNHRVKNNLQIIVSLMNLQKRMMPPERREDIRFIEEHVQSMSVAYRLVYATGSMVEVSLDELLTEVLSGLRQIAGLAEESMCVEARAAEVLIGLDHAIALGLYLAVLLPPYFNRAVATHGSVTVRLGVAAGLLTLSVRGTWTTPVVFDLLRGRLMQAYAAQLKAEIFPAATYGEEQLRFSLQEPAGVAPRH